VLYLQKLRITLVGVELLDGLSGDVRWCLDFRDMDSPAIIVLADSFGKRSQEGGGFLLCPLYGRKWKAFMAASGATNTGIISHLVCSCFLICLIYLCITDFNMKFG
jgi:DnaJ homolog subfamily C member 13